MQMPERHVVRTGEGVGRDGFDAADEPAQGALATADIATVHEGMGHDHPPGAGRDVRASGIELSAQNVLRAI